MKKPTLMELFVDGKPSEATFSQSELAGVLVSDEEVGNLAAMFEHPGYAVYARLLQQAANLAIGNTMGSTSPTTQAQYDVAKGVYQQAEELLVLPTEVRDLLKNIQEKSKLRKTA